MAGMIFLALRAKRPKKRRRPPGSRVKKTLLPRVIELLGEADNPEFDQKSPVNGYAKPFRPYLLNYYMKQILAAVWIKGKSSGP